MTPVEATAISSAFISNCVALKFAVSNASFNPCSPVQALAYPVLIMIPLKNPLLIFFE